MFHVIVNTNTGGWHDCGEGPWDRFEQALNSADVEVGMPWIVVHRHATESGMPLAYGDHRGTHYTECCPDCELSREAGFGDSGCERCGT